MNRCSLSNTPLVFYLFIRFIFLKTRKRKKILTRETYLYLNREGRLLISHYESVYAKRVERGFLTFYLPQKFENDLYGDCSLKSVPCIVHLSQNLILSYLISSKYICACCRHLSRKFLLLKYQCCLIYVVVRHSVHGAKRNRQYLFLKLGGSHKRPAVTYPIVITPLTANGSVNKTDCRTCKIGFRFSELTDRWCYRCYWWFNLFGDRMVINNLMYLCILLCETLV